MLHQHAPSIPLIAPSSTTSSFFKLPFRPRRKYSVAAILPAILVLNAESFTPSEQARHHEVHGRRDSVLSAKAIEAGYPMEIDADREIEHGAKGGEKPPLPPRSPLRDHPIFRERVSEVPSVEDAELLRQGRPSITVTDSDDESGTVVLYSPFLSLSEDGDGAAEVGAALAQRRRSAREAADGDEDTAGSDDQGDDTRHRGRGSRRRTSSTGRKHRRRSVSRASRVYCE